MHVIIITNPFIIPVVTLAIFTTWKSNILLGDDVVALKAPDNAINEQFQSTFTVPVLIMFIMLIPRKEDI